MVACAALNYTCLCGNVTGFRNIECVSGAGVSYATGNPIFAGFLLVVFFLGFLVLQKASFSVKVLVMVPAIVLSLNFFPSYVAVFACLGFAFVLYRGLMWVQNQ